MNKVEKIIVDIIIFVLIVIVLILMCAFYQVNIKKNDYANIFGYTIFQVETGSMEPTIAIDDFIIIKLNAEMKENDIITYKSGDDFITHRLLKIQDDTLITKGDNNNTEDDPIEKNNAIGKVVFIINEVDVWKKVFSDIKVIISLAITIILFILIIVYKDKKIERKIDD